MPRTCRNCDADAVLGQAYCGFCGQQYASERLTLHAIGHDALHALFHVDRSAVSLARMLLVRPGTVALNYVRGQRKRYFGPFSSLVIVVAAASAAIALTGFRVVSAPTANVVVDFIQSHVNLLMFAEVPLLAGFSRLLDVRGRFNLAEHLVLAAYTSSMRVLFVTLIVIPVWYIFRLDNLVVQYLGALAVWGSYFGFAASQFFPDRRALSWCRGFLAAVLASAAVAALATLAASVLS